jgi:hypothetical protein
LCGVEKRFTRAWTPCRRFGSVVEIYEPDGLEVEFVKASGETLAVITISENRIRPVDASDIVSVRSLSHAA